MRRGVIQVMTRLDPTVSSWGCIPTTAFTCKLKIVTHSTGTSAVAMSLCRSVVSKFSKKHGNVSSGFYQIVTLLIVKKEKVLFQIFMFSRLAVKVTSYFRHSCEICTWLPENGSYVTWIYSTIKKNKYLESIFIIYFLSQFFQMDEWFFGKFSIRLSTAH